MPRWRWLMAQVARRLWVRATLIGSMGILAAVLAAGAERYLPWRVPGTISTDALDSILTVIASSMLSVTTFSLNIMVSSYGSATSNVTPRATKLLIEDGLTQTVLSTFLGSFLFGIAGLVVSKTGAYGEQGRSILFAVTVAVIALIVVSLLRWIHHLTRLGRVGETTDRVEAATQRAIAERLRDPYLGGRRLTGGPPAAAHPIVIDAIGYVRHIDMQILSRFCERLDTDLFIAALPGSFVHPQAPVAWIGRLSPDAEEELHRAVSRAFTIGNERSFDQDPRFGLAVLSEIGSRALSPATNDPGTAIDVVGRSTRLLSQWARGSDDRNKEPEHPRIHVPAIATADMFEDAFMLMARDGAGLIEVQLRIQKALIALERLGHHLGDAAFREAARCQARMALDRAEAAFTLEADTVRLRELARHLGAGLDARDRWDASAAPR